MLESSAFLKFNSVTYISLKERVCEGHFLNRERTSLFS